MKRSALIALLASAGVLLASEDPKPETKYVSFQVQTGLYGYASQFHPPAGRFALTKAQMEEFVHDIVHAIGITGDARNKLTFAVGPLCFDMSDAETQLPGWVQKSGEQAQATLLMQKLTTLIKERKFQEADKVADELLSLMSRIEKK